MSAGAKVTANFPTSVWSGTSPSRSNPTTYREAMADDWNQIVAELEAVQTSIIAVETLTLAATITPKMTAYSNHKLTVAGGTQAAVTLNADSGGNVGLEATFFIYTSDTTATTITFGTNFRSTGTLTTGTVAGKVFILVFVSDGTNWIEVSRTTAQS